MNYISYTTEETEEFAANLAKKLVGGEIITLDGDLGAGKTAFVRGLARGLDIKDRVSSPTFTIVNEYRNGKIPSALHFLSTKRFRTFSVHPIFLFRTKA